MAWLFSKRCARLLNNEVLKVSIPRPVRNRIWHVMVENNEYKYQINYTGYDYQISTLEELPDLIKAELGCDALMAWPEEGNGPAGPSDLEGFIKRTYIPAQLFDALELYYMNLSDSLKNSFQYKINQIFDESNLKWRMANGKIFPVDSKYIEDEIINKANYFLEEVGFQGALYEFEKARIDLVNKDYEGAINNANLSVESTIKGVLGIERAKPGELFRLLIDSGLFPEYYDGFLKAFEENILRCVAIIRNEELGTAHGQGVKRNVIPPSLAELAVHLAGAIIIFLIKRYCEKHGVEGNDNGEIACDEDDVVF